MPSLLRLRPSAVLRTLSAPPYSSSATHSSKKVNEPLDMKNIDLALDKVFIICGGIRILAAESKPRSLSAQWALGVSHILVVGAIAKALNIGDRDSAI
ncbi:hypothetical protein DAI22_02g021400 [Oryza sativa Japonica Group]|nr:hypothetical protein DAI22_02g021400 [Oryza sativa Japonica Group]